MRDFREKSAKGFARFAAALLVTLILGVLSSPAVMAGVVSGTGPLNDVDPDAGIVEIRDRSFDVHATSVLLDSDGKRMSMLELEEVQAPWVIFKTRPGDPRRILDTLQLIDEDADEMD